MLTLTRKENQSLFIEPVVDINPDMTVAELFANGGIEIFITGTQRKQVRIGVVAPHELNIARGELKNK